MMWTVVHHAVPYLSKPFREALLEYQKIAEGTKAAKPRWLTCVEEMNGYSNGLSLALGYLYVQHAFDVKIVPFVSINDFLIIFNNDNN